MEIEAPERRQHSQLCPKCKASAYSLNMVCNTPGCGQVREEEKQTTGRNIHERMSRVWDKKEHKYKPIDSGGLKKY
jgi:hypothetical protein